MSENCNCPCMDCIEGRHCGELYWISAEASADGQEHQFECNEATPDDEYVDMGYERLDPDEDDPMPDDRDWYI